MGWSTPRVVKAVTTYTSGAAFSTPGTPVSIAPGGGGVVSVELNCTAVTGNPNLTVTVSWSMDGATWGTLDGTAETFAAITGAPYVRVKELPIKGTYYKLTGTAITGTGAATIGVKDLTWRNFGTPSD